MYALMVSGGFISLEVYSKQDKERGYSWTYNKEQATTFPDPRTAHRVGKKLLSGNYVVVKVFLVKDIFNGLGD